MRGEAGVLIATLGTKPQVVTTAADLLLRDGHALHDVVVLHTAAEDGVLAEPLSRLRREFAAHPPYAALQLHLHPIPGPVGAVPDITTRTEAEAVFRAIYRTVLTAKRADRRVHFSIVGGRKVLAVYGMATAQLLFDDDDRLWYVLAGGRFFAEERLHPEEGDEAKLVPVPVLRWSTISPALTDLNATDDPFEAVERQRRLRLQEQLDDARAFVLGLLSGAEQRVLELLVREGLSNAEIGERLNNSPRTVERHLGEIAAKAAIHWGLANVTRTQLVRLLSLYYTLNPKSGGNPA